MARFNVYSKRHVESAYRSGLEDKVADALRVQGVPFKYEELTVHWVQPTKPRRYTPDFLLLSNSIIIETKGKFDTADRQKHKFIKQQYPDLDIRFVFSNPNATLSKASSTRYRDWCDQYGFMWAAKSIPLEWLEEPPKDRTVAAVARLLNGQ